MLSFLARRLLASIGVLLAASFVVYLLAASTGDPLADLRTSSARNKDQLIAARIEMLHLDVPVVFRYFVWLWGVIRGLWGQFDLGESISGGAVVDSLARAVPVTIQLLITSSVLAIIIGIAVGVASALRQYSAFDYTVTFVSFFLFSLPSFFIAVILKAWLGIGFNDFLTNPQLPWWVILIVALVLALFWMALIGGEWRRRLIVFATAAVATAVAMVVMNATDWFERPWLTIGGVAVLGIAAALGLTYLLASFANRRALWSSLTVAALGIALYYPFVNGLAGYVTGIWIFIGFGALAVIVGGFVGWAFGGPDRWVSARIGALTAFVTAGATALDRFMQSWGGYATQIAQGRPIATIGSATPNLDTMSKSFWIFGVDTFTHLLLPTISICLLSIAGYSRYTRASLLDVVSHDYIRTARAKGLPERTVIVRHAFRNALIPITTLVTLDFGALVGGAIITETIFSWQGMGLLFNTALNKVDVNELMGFFLVTGTVAILFNFVADLAYSALDPRIRVNA